MLTTGTAAGHNDLMDKLVAWLVGTVGWTQLEYSGVTSPPLSTDLRSAVLRAPGALTGAEAFLYLNSKNNPGQGYYGWEMRMAAGYDNTQPITAQLLVSPPVYFNTWQNTIDYWFYANDRRVIVVAKVNTSYVSMYAGLFLPFALPTEYLRPFCLIGNYPTLDSYDVANSRNRMIADPGQNCAQFLGSSGTNWYRIENHGNSASATSRVQEPQAFMWPHATAITSSSAQFDGWPVYGLTRMRPNAAGEIPNFLCHIQSSVDGRRLEGVLEGVYSAGGFGRTSEQTLTSGLMTLRLFQNVFRTTPRDFMAIEEL